ncbi:MAG: hypothetical protein JWM10_4733 [Myxococcaceae bacterium]|nr:hypothetical protein [Myxococcaceae bacterium]
MLAVCGLAGCGGPVSGAAPVDAGGADGATACFPECRAGSVCSPAGVCVSGCNPACGAGETCVGSGAGARCESGTADGGTTSDLGGNGADVATDTGVVADTGAVADNGTTADIGVVTDIGAPTDVPPASDVVATSDVPPASDVVATSDVVAVDRPTPADLGAPVDAPAGADVVDAGTPTVDAGAADAFVPPMNCGMPGQPCCAGRGCYAGGYCEAAVCRAPSARDPGECSRAEECAAGQSCGGPFVCGGTPDAGVASPRRCFHCEAPPGAGAFGAACANGGECQGGVCSNGRCTVACPIGEAGDALCRARGASQRCVNVFYQPVSMGPLTTLGVCAPSCARDADCPADLACVPRLNYFADRMDFVCAPPPASATTAVGGACNPSGASTCRNVLCVGTSATAGYCTAPCAVDGDCPAAAPACAPITYTRPSGAGQPDRGCAPR